MFALDHPNYARWLPVHIRDIMSLNRPWATRNPPPPWGFFTVVIFEASEYGPIEIRLFAFKLLGLNMLKYANQALSQQLIKLES